MVLLKQEDHVIDCLEAPDGRDRYRDRRGGITCRARRRRRVGGCR